MTCIQNVLQMNLFTVSLQEIHMRKTYKSTGIFDQQVVSRDTMPTAMLETYNQCDKPPPLYKLNPYRLVFVLISRCIDRLCELY